MRSAQFNHGAGQFLTWSGGLYWGAFGDGANLLFYDGHVKWFGFDNLEPVGYIVGAAYHDVLAWSVLQ